MTDDKKPRRKRGVLRGDRMMQRGKSGKKIYEEELVYSFLNHEKWGLPGTKGTFLSNFWAYTQQEHQLLSVFKAHRMHPFSQKERMVVLFCSFGLAFMLTASFMRPRAKNFATCNVGCEDEYESLLCGDNPCNYQAGQQFGTGIGEEECGAITCNDNPLKRNGQTPDCSNPFIINSNGNSPCDSCSFYTKDEYEKACVNGQTSNFESMVIAIFVMIFDSFLRMLATCGCVQNKGKCIEGCCEALGSAVLCNLAFMSVFFWIGGVAIATSGEDPLGDNFIGMFLQAKFYGWIYWFLYQLPIFAVTYKKFKKNFEEDFPGVLCLPDDDEEAKVADLVLFPDLAGKPLEHHKGTVAKAVDATKKAFGFGSKSAKVAPDSAAQQTVAVDVNGDGNADFVVPAQQKAVDTTGDGFADTIQLVPSVQGQAQIQAAHNQMAQNQMAAQVMQQQQVYQQQMYQQQPQMPQPGQAVMGGAVMGGAIMGVASGGHQQMQQQQMQQQQMQQQQMQQQQMQQQQQIYYHQQQQSQALQPSQAMGGPIMGAVAGGLQQMQANIIGEAQQMGLQVPQIPQWAGQAMEGVGTVANNVQQANVAP